MTQCYTFSVDFDSEEICEYYTKCEDARFLSRLLKANESDYVTIVHERSSAEIVAKVPDECDTCSTSSPTSSAGLSNGVIAAVVVSVVVAIIIVVFASILVVVLFYCNKTQKRDTHIGSL